MTTFRTATDEYTVPDDFYTPAAAYSPDAGPGRWNVGTRAAPR